MGTIKKRVAHYLQNGDFEEAFVGIWLLLRDKRELTRYKNKSMFQRPLYETASEDTYHDSSLVDNLRDASFKYQGHTLFEYLDHNPFELLWLLDFFLHSRRRAIANPTQRIRFELAPDSVEEIYLIPRNPLKTMARTSHYQVTDYWKCHPCHTVFPANIGGMSVHIDPINHRARDALRKLKSIEELRIYVNDLDDKVYPILDGGIAKGLSDVAARQQAVKQHLQQAAEQGCHMVVFPELSVNEDVRKEIVQWLRDNEYQHNIIWVVAGSFHEPLSEDTSRWINRSYSYGHSGVLMHKHTKFSQHGSLLGFVEDIKEWVDIWVLNTPLGLAGTPICLDFCQGNYCSNVDSYLLEQLVLELCFVPAMDKSKSAFKRKAEHLHRFGGTRSAVAIQRPPEVKTSLKSKPRRKKPLSFVHP
ncbi:MAG: hypothetical protein CMK89_13920 [Pseudomonadales bacterium]|nr:hypothetical protein [Pseudomonadales bacterium]